LEKVILKNDQHIECNALESAVDDSEKKFHDSIISHQYIITTFDDKYNDLVLFLKQFETKNSGKIVIFCEQKETANALSESLKA
ncbi:hypothetical protein ABK046_49625, partial [Streptomyces caeruleatus]